MCDGLKVIPQNMIWGGGGGWLCIQARDYAFIWVYNTIMLEVDYSLGLKIDDLEAHMNKTTNNIELV